jgi:predicted Zn-dependent protease
MDFLIKNPWMKSQEIQADNFALKHLKMLGGNPKKFPELYMNVVKNKADENEKTSFFSIHPSNDDRIKNMYKQLCKLGYITKAERNVGIKETSTSFKQDEQLKKRFDPNTDVNEL